MSEYEDSYNKALDYLYSFVDFSMQKAQTYSPERFKLERMLLLASSLGNPQHKYPTIHVAGTKGKGSVSVMCASALRAAGYRVGLYTSPHLDDYAERIQIDSEFIPHTDLVSIVEEIKPHVEEIPELTTFEITTALAFLYFAKKNVTAAVIEVGLGGRLDATNVLIPKVSVITSISYDHTHLLGDTLTQIAGEKAGIIKTGVPVVVSPQKEEARVVIERVAHECSAPLVQVGQDYLFEVISHSLEGQELRVWVRESPKNSAINLTIPLLGYHQVANAATAYAVLETGNQNGLPIPLEAIRTGFADVFWPGRFEVVNVAPPVILDCAHNRDSAQKLGLTLDEYYSKRPVFMIFGASEDKDILGMFAELMPMVREMIAVKSFHPRAIEPEKLVEMALLYKCPAQIMHSIPEAMEKAVQFAGENGIVLVTGSIFVVAEARKYWEKKAKIRRY
jgi:dihydrofolate synthase / folylpolyglutamate synthase